MNKTIIKYLLISILIITALSSVLFIHYVYSPGPLENKTLVVIEKGSVHSTSETLMYAGVVSTHSHNFGGFKSIYFLFFSNQSLKAGEYEFEPGISVYNVLKKLTDGDVYYRQITIPEGLTTTEILDKITAEYGLFGDVPGDIDEGVLLPETYSFTYGFERTKLIKEMYNKRYALLENLWQDRLPGLPFKTKEEALILASIVEKETGINDERGKVASVFVNRLHKGMPLQADPTAAYAVTMGKTKLDRELTRKDLQIDSPYNTYKYPGLPPGPICNPGKAAIEAVFNPEQTDYLYFVADGNGGHNFAKTLAEHERNVRKYRIEKKNSKN